MLVVPDLLNILPMRTLSRLWSWLNILSTLTVTASVNNDTRNYEDCNARNSAQMSELGIQFAPEDADPQTHISPNSAINFGELMKLSA